MASPREAEIFIDVKRQRDEARAERDDLAARLERAETERDRLIKALDDAEHRADRAVSLSQHNSAVAVQLRRKIAAVWELHSPMPGDQYAEQRCQGCIAGYDPRTDELVHCAYPCATVRALDAAPTAGQEVDS